MSLAKVGLVYLETRGRRLAIRPDDTGFWTDSSKEVSATGVRAMIEKAGITLEWLRTPSPLVRAMMERSS